MDYNKEFNINIKSSIVPITLTGTYTNGGSFNEIFTNETDAKSFISTNKSTLKTIKVDEPTGIFTNCYLMFNECVNLTNIDLSTFNTLNVTIFRQMFYNCTSLTSMDVSNFDISNINDLNGLSAIFMGCTNILSINIPFDTSSYNGYMYEVFRNCSKLTSLDLSSFDMSGVIANNNMFNGCTSLTTAYGRTQADCDKLNASSSKPVNVNFVVKS